MGSFASYEARKPTILTVPGLGGSGRSHWQSPVSYTHLTLPTIYSV